MLRRLRPDRGLLAGLLAAATLVVAFTGALIVANGAGGPAPRWPSAVTAPRSVAALPLDEVALKRAAAGRPTPLPRSVQHAVGTTHVQPVVARPAARSATPAAAGGGATFVQPARRIAQRPAARPHRGHAVVTPAHPVVTPGGAGVAPGTGSSPSAPTRPAPVVTPPSTSSAPVASAPAASTPVASSASAGDQGDQGDQGGSARSPDGSGSSGSGDGNDQGGGDRGGVVTRVVQTVNTAVGETLHQVGHRFGGQGNDQGQNGG